MSVNTYDIVRPVNGRDAGKIFFVISVENGYAYLCDGKGRTLEKPKKKKAKHVQPAFGKESGIIGQAHFPKCENPTNAQLRRAIAEVKQLAALRHTEV